MSEFDRDDGLAEVRASEARYRGLLEAAPDAIVVVDEASEIVLLNLRAEKQFGYNRYELVGQPVTNIIPEGFAERLIADDLRSAADALAQQIGTGIELVARRKDGTEFPIEIMLSPLDSAEGVLVTAAVRDISVRKAAEVVLVQMEARYRGLLEAAPDAMVVVDQAGSIVLLNVQAEKQFGYRRDELLGQPVTNLIPEGFAERLAADALRSAEDALAQIIGTGLELVARRKDGTDFPIELMLSPLDSAEGILVTAAIRDISGRRMLEAQLRQAQKMEAVGQLAGGVAHDFNNLLTVILGHANLLARGLSDRDPLRESAEEIRDAGDRAAAMTVQLLAFSRRLVLAPALLDLRALVTNIERLLQRMIGEDVTLSTILDADIGVVLADAGQIEQVLMNLAVNARDAMPDGGTLTITVGEEAVTDQVHADAKDLTIGDYVTMVIADSGTGMTAETRQHMFEPFYTTKGVDHGTGLGLATAYGIVKQSGGSIAVDSRLGEGATFTVYLPRLDAEAALTPDVPPAVARVRATETVLLVEDDHAVRRLTRHILEDRGYMVIEASAGAEGLAISRGHNGPIHLLLTDVIMPGMNGRELAATLSTERPETRVVFMSAYPDDAVLRQDLGRVAFLHKPFSADGLAEKLREAIA